MNSPAAGTLNFLFTDIEGSTRLWERLPGNMRTALARHDEIMRTAIESTGGRVVSTAGDAFFAVFATASAALAASLAAQRALAAEVWPDGCAIRARMALHAGEAIDERDGDYFGPALNRSARLLAAGHGGQILLSAASYELARHALPAQVTVRDMGSHLLKDLTHPEHIYQVVVPDLPSEFPALRTLDARLSNLPAEITPFIGRAGEVSALCDLLAREETRIVTLLGPGGVGKTRLSLRCAAALTDVFDRGTVFVPLSSVPDPALFPAGLAEALHLYDAGERRALEVVLEHIKNFRLLLVLDNFEHILGAAGDVARLIAECPQLTILVTSRELLRVSGEHSFSVPPLSLPRLRGSAPADAGDSDAVRLFVERSRKVRPDFALTDDNAGAVAEICIRLDGLPLAIELAAARVRILNPNLLLERLRSRLNLLTGGARDLPARQQTLRAAIDWSYELLSDADRTLFARLAVFSGGCSLEAAEDVCNGDLDVLEGITSLIDKSLVRHEEDPAAEPRFSMLETIREYGVERLQTLDGHRTLRRRHAAHFAGLAKHAKGELEGPRQRQWLDRLETEHGNFRAALRNSIDSGDTAVAVTIAHALYNFWRLRGHLIEAEDWITEILDRLDDMAPNVRAQALHVGALIASQLGHVGRAGELFDGARALYEALDDRAGLAATVNGLASTVSAQGDRTRARQLYEESLAIFRELQRDRQVALLLGNLAILSAVENDLAQATKLVEEALTLHCRTGDPDQIAGSLWDLSTLAADGGDSDRAQELKLQALALWKSIDHVEGVILMLEELATILSGCGTFESAVVLLAAAQSLRDREGVTRQLLPAENSDRILHDARKSLGHGVYDQTWQHGSRLAPIEALAEAGLTIPEPQRVMSGLRR